MKFGEMPLEEAGGGILAHTHRLPPGALDPRGAVLKKGRRLGPRELALLAEAGHERVWAAVPEPGDVEEDEAAARLAEVLPGGHVRLEPPATGRVNVFSTARGVLVVDGPGIDAINALDARLTVATLAPYRVVEPGDMVGTVKIIPFAVPGSALQAARAAAARARPVLEVRPFVSKRVALVVTDLPGVAEQQLERATATQAARVEGVGSRLEIRLRVPHATGALSEALQRALGEGAELVLLLGASAMVDVGDVLPAAILRAGGELVQVGMPVDPGNLLVLGRCGRVPVVGVPGCARSPKRSGFDAVLERLAADIPIEAADVRRMGVGGLLAEIASRPRPRQEPPVPPPLARVAGVVLAAGRSTRMGPKNKLLERVEGVPMIARVVDSLIGTRLDPIVVVVGHEAADVRAALRGRPVKIVENPRYAEGLSTSLAAGVSALDAEVDGVLVALGDMPLLASAHVEALLDAFEPEGDRGICVPVAGGRRGNPVLFHSKYFAELRAIEGDVGARALLDRHASAVREVPFEDPGVLVDVDTPAALEALVTRHDLPA